MAELHARGRGLVEHAQHLEAGRAKGFRRQKSLVAVGIGRHADHGLERLGAIERQRGSLAQLLAERGEQLGCQFHERYGAAGEVQRVVGPARFSSRLSERNTVHSRSPCTAHALQPKRRSSPRIATSGGNHSRDCPSGDSKPASG
jgi:hypothetical protein